MRSSASIDVTELLGALAIPVVWSATPSALETAPGNDAAEKSLIEGSLGGDGDAFEELVRRHQNRVFRLASRFFPASTVEDVAQETFLLAWRKLATYRHDAPFEHWITRICLNCCYGRLRKKSGNEAPLPDVELETPQRDLDVKLLVRSLLERLDPTDRFLLILLEWEGHSVAAVAERLGWTSVNVRVRAYRARKRLRGLLEESAR